MKKSMMIIMLSVILTCITNCLYSCMEKEANNIGTNEVKINTSISCFDINNDKIFIENSFREQVKKSIMCWCANFKALNNIEFEEARDSNLEGLSIITNSFS